MKKFTLDDMPQMSDKVAIVTGANSGLGFYTALGLASADCKVILACRNEHKAKIAIDDIKSRIPDAKLDFIALDLASLESVAGFIKAWQVRKEQKLDILINNAGVMNLPNRTLTKNGFEMQFGTNHLGHFALTIQLLPFLKQAKAPRLIVMSSMAAYYGKIKLDNLNSEKSYSPMKAYSQSKLANLIFALTLAKKEPWLTSLAVHPGIAYTDIQRYNKGIFGIIMRSIPKIVGQSVEDGALPSLYTASSKAVVSGKFYGPEGKGPMSLPNKGSAIEVAIPKHALDDKTAKSLWKLSAKLTNISI